MQTLKRAGIAGMIASAAVLAGSFLPAHAATPGWRQVYSHHYGAAANFPTYAAVAALTPTNAWAFGGTDASYGTGTSQVPVILHWNGKAWTGSAGPSGLTGTITSASAPAANDIWAITGASGWILHYDGHGWRVAKHITGFGQLTGVTAVSPTNVWVFGGPGADPGLGTWHYNGKTWAHLTTGSAGGLESASAVSARDIWAVGSTVSPGSSIDRFNGSAWTQVSAKSLPPGQWQYTGIWASSDKNVWVSASVSANSIDVPYLLHYNGATWSKWALPWAVIKGNNEGIFTPTPDGAGGLWFTGFTMQNGPGNDFTRTSYAVHRSAAGVWGRVKTGVIKDTTTFSPSGASLGGLALIPGTRSLWGVGFTELPTIGGDAVIWAYGAV